MVSRLKKNRSTRKRINELGNREVFFILWWVGGWEIGGFYLLCLTK